MKTFEFIGPAPVDVHLTVSPGDVIGVPDDCAGSSPTQEFDDNDVLVSQDLGSGLLAQPSLWRPVGKALSEMTIAELEAHAETAGIDLDGAKKKADIINQIEKES